MTIKEIAKIAGVSTTTVSYVINDTKNVLPETRRKVLDAIEQWGYRPNYMAKGLRIKRTNTIGVLVEDIMGFPVPAIINGISEYMEKNDYRILLNDLKMLESLFNHYDQVHLHKEKINEVISMLLHEVQVDAIIYVGMIDRNITGLINKIDKPFVLAFSTSNDPYTTFVDYDNENISAEAIQYLFDLGHTDIAVITGLTHTTASQLRMKGVQRAFREAGKILNSAFVKYGDWGYESGRACMKELLTQELHNPTALFAMGDLMAAGAMDVIKSAGLRIPDDISIIGFNNMEICLYLNPKLSSIEIDLKGVGYIAAEIAVEKINGMKEGGRDVKNNECNIVIPSKLILRDTIAPLVR